MSRLEHLNKLNKEQQKLLLNKWKQDEIRDTKLSIISQAYSSSLSYNDLYELSELLKSIAQHKELNRKKGL